MSTVPMSEGHRFTFAASAGTPVLLHSSNHVGETTLFENKVLIATTHPDITQKSLLQIDNSSNQVSDGTCILLRNTSTGDPTIMFNADGEDYTMGIDNSDGNKFKISNASSLSTTAGLTAIEIDPSVGAATGISFFPNDRDCRMYLGNSARADAADEYPMNLDDGDLAAYFHVGSSGDDFANMIAVMGDDALNGGQSDAIVYFGQSHNHGGFVMYQGNSAGPGEFDNLETDDIMLGRVSGGTPEDVIFFAHDSNDVSVLGTLTDGVSDERVKENIVEIPNAVDKIKTLRGVTFDFNAHAVETHFMSQEDWDRGKQTGHVGLIAQEVEKVLPEAVRPAPISKRKEYADYKTIHYNKLTALLVQGIKEQQETIDDLKARIITLENR